MCTISMILSVPLSTCPRNVPRASPAPKFGRGLPHDCVEGWDGLALLMGVAIMLAGKVVVSWDSGGGSKLPICLPIRMPKTHVDIGKCTHIGSPHKLDTRSHGTHKKCSSIPLIKKEYLQRTWGLRKKCHTYPMQKREPPNEWEDG